MAPFEVGVAVKLIHAKPQSSQFFFKKFERLAQVRIFLFHGIVNEVPLKNIEKESTLAYLGHYVYFVDSVP